MYITPDSVKQGALLAEQYCRSLGNSSGKMLTLMSRQGQQVDEDRKKGFHDFVKQTCPKNFPNLAYTTYGNGTREDAYKKVMGYLMLDPDLDSVFAVHDEMAIGAMNAVKDHRPDGLDGFYIMGIDYTAEAVIAVMVSNASCVEMSPSFHFTLTQCPPNCVS